MEIKAIFRLSLEIQSLYAEILSEYFLVVVLWFFFLISAFFIWLSPGETLYM